MSVKECGRLLPRKEKNMEWKNYGDINYLSYGCIQVKDSYTEEEKAKYPSLKNVYDVFYYNPELEDEEKAIAWLGTVDIDDYINDRQKRLDILYLILLLLCFLLLLFHSLFLLLH